MKVRLGYFGRATAVAALAAAFFLPAVFTAAQQVDMNVVDQPGYQPTPDEEQLSGAYERQEVFFRTSEAPGTIIIDTKGRFLYLVQPNNRALRYGIGVGRDGFQWSGLQKISRKQEWPDWRPPPEMIERQPYLPRFMAGGPGNPLGARAMYLGRRSIASTAPTSRRRSATPSRPDVSAWSTRTSSISTVACRSGPRSSSNRPSRSDCDAKPRTFEAVMRIRNRFSPLAAALSFGAAPPEPRPR